MMSFEADVLSVSPLSEQIAFKGECCCSMLKNTEKWEFNMTQVASGPSSLQWSMLPYPQCSESLISL